MRKPPMEKGGFFYKWCLAVKKTLPNHFPINDIVRLGLFGCSHRYEPGWGKIENI